MPALTADRNTERKDGVLVPTPVIQNDCIYGGSLVAINAAGYALPGSDTAGLIFHGIADARADNSTGANGAINVIARRRGLFLFALATPITIANVGDNVFLVDDQTVDLTANVTNKIFCGIIAGYHSTTAAWIDIEPAIKQADVATHISDGSGAHAAAAISLADTGAFTAATTVEAALAEIYPKIPVAIADPGAAGAIPVTRSGTVAITTAAAETRTLAIPAAAGLVLTLALTVDGGNAVITAASAINTAGNNTITMQDAGDVVTLTAVQVGAALAWRVTANDTCAVSTV